MTAAGTPVPRIDEKTGVAARLADGADDAFAHHLGAVGKAGNVDDGNLR